MGKEGPGELAGVTYALFSGVDIVATQDLPWSLSASARLRVVAPAGDGPGGAHVAMHEIDETPRPVTVSCLYRRELKRALYAAMEAAGESVGGLEP